MTDEKTEKLLDKSKKDLVEVKKVLGDQPKQIITPEQMKELEKLKDHNDSGNMKLMIKATLKIFIKDPALLEQIDTLLDMFYPELEGILKANEQESIELNNRLNRIEQNMKVVNDNLKLIYGEITGDPKFKAKKPKKERKK